MSVGSLRARHSQLTQLRETQCPVLGVHPPTWFLSEWVLVRACFYKWKKEQEARLHLQFLFVEKKRGFAFSPEPASSLLLCLNQQGWFGSSALSAPRSSPLIPLPSSIFLVFMHIICLASALGTSKTMRTFSCHRYPLMCPFWVGSLNCLLNKTLTSSPQPCPYSILASQLYWQQCLSTHFYGGLKEIDYYCAQIKWGSNATPVWLSCNWSELYTGAICNIFSKLNFFLFGFYWCMFRCPLGLPFFQWKLQHVNFHTNYSNSRYLYLIHYNRSNQG